jgi:hypothetical protein
VGDPNNPNRIWGLRKNWHFTYLSLDQRDGNSENSECRISFLFFTVFISCQKRWAFCIFHGNNQIVNDFHIGDVLPLFNIKEA